MAVTLEQFRTATKDLDGSTELWVDDEGAVLAAWKMHNEQLNGEFVVLSTYRDPSSPQKQEVFTLRSGSMPSSSGSSRWWDRPRRTR